MKTINRLFPIAAILGVTSILPLSVYANSFQRFAGISYDNPAQLAFIKKLQIILGNSYGHAPMKYTGVSARFAGISPGASGIAQGLGSQNLPYGRIAARINRLFVAGVDVTEPFAIHVEYPATSVVRYTGFQNILNTYDISPKVAVNLGKKVAFGVGIDEEYLRAQQARMIPVPRLGDVEYYNEGTNWGTGWDMGVTYMPTAGTILGISYFSQINHIIRGDSNFVPIAGTNNAYADLPMPATANLTAVQYLTKKWLLMGGINYTDWKILKNVALVNVALPSPRFPVPTPPIRFQYHNTWRAGVGTQYNLSNQWGVRIGGFVDESPAITQFRTDTLPATTYYGLGGGFHYQIAPALGFDLDYLHAFFPNNIPINNVFLGSIGNLDISADAVNGKLTWSI